VNFKLREAFTKPVVLLAAFSTLLFLIAPARAQSCFTASIVKPTPFMGNNDEIFQLSDGSLWQVKYEYEYLYEYLYEYYPNVIVCPSMGKLIVKGKQLDVVQLSASQVTRPGNAGIVQSRIDGEFKGWEGGTIYRLRNGQIWEQGNSHYHYHYAYSPEVLVYPSDGGFKMHVKGDDDEDVPVRRIQ
jgi:hypothetical protein